MLSNSNSNSIRKEKKRRKKREKKTRISCTRLRSSMKYNDRYRFGKYFRYHPTIMNYLVGSIDSHIDAIVTLTTNNHHTMLLEYNTYRDCSALILVNILHCIRSLATTTLRAHDSFYNIYRF